MKSKYRHEQLVLKFRQSGLSRREFCRQYSLNYGTFGTWLKLQPDKMTSDFTEINLLNTQTQILSTEQIILKYSNTVEVYFPQSISPIYLGQILNQLLVAGK